jgi:hypothetical protein
VGNNSFPHHSVLLQSKNNRPISKALEAPQHKFEFSVENHARVGHRQVRSSFKIGPAAPDKQQSGEKNKHILAHAPQQSDAPSSSTNVRTETWSLEFFGVEFNFTPKNLQTLFS